MGELEAVLQALARSGGRYRVVGGVGVVLHGFPRFTADLDLVVQLVPANLECVLRALSELRSKRCGRRIPMSITNAWDAQRRQQIRPWKALSYAERLRWLDEAKAFAAKATGAARRNKSSTRAR